MAVRAARGCVKLHQEGSLDPGCGGARPAGRSGSGAEPLCERQHPAIQAAEREQARRESLRAARAALATGLSDGAISEQVYDELVAEIDAALGDDQTAKL
jgi:hypothetical protein